MAYTIIKYVIFAGCFGLAFQALSCIQFEKFVDVRQPRKAMLLLFILSFVVAYLMTQGILSLTMYSDWGAY
ncbi:DUF1146 domain-containing protein [Catenisphaera adipataccumulans]|jgi:uncharacterized membrane protein YwzB|uniref:Putative membrane protein YwzB n=1 Tax=Catenisphaera adipataccumulans TaxID=700500 RepID=A0A7W8CXF0_9FIRM|nr:DUF1146 domain-containing protein [Catenisphaera adipataccumulans]MBB5183387.1 putative membrane protein YwzB [Catenisphaera adipataccumulans]